MQGEGAADRVRPLGDAVDEAVRAADNRQEPLPLRPGLEPFLLAVGLGFAGHHDHRNTLAVRRIDPHGALQQPDPGMQHHGLHPPGHHGVSHGEIDRERLVRAAQVDGTVGIVGILAGESFPHGAPFGTGRGHHVIHVQTPERLDNRFAAIKIVFHRNVPSWPHRMRGLQGQSYRDGDG